MSSGVRCAGKDSPGCGWAPGGSPSERLSQAALLDRCSDRIPSAGPVWDQLPEVMVQVRPSKVTGRHRGGTREQPASY
jgi:hypothetical protein